MILYEKYFFQPIWNGIEEVPIGIFLTESTDKIDSVIL